MQSSKYYDLNSDLNNIFTNERIGITASTTDIMYNCDLTKYRAIMVGLGGEIYINNPVAVSIDIFKYIYVNSVCYDGSIGVVIGACTYISDTQIKIHTTHASYPVVVYGIK